MVHENPKSFDSARISRWRVESATGPLATPDYGIQEPNSLNHGSDLMFADVPCQTATAFPNSEANSFPTLHSVPPNLPYGPGMTFNEPSTASAGNGLFCDQGFDLIPPFDNTTHGSTFAANIMDNQMNLDYVTGDLFPYGVAEAHPSLVLGNNSPGLDLSTNWGIPDEQMPQPLDWSPASGLTPSSSSLQSSHSFLGHHSDTPVSTSMYEGFYAASHQSQENGEHGPVPPYSLGEAVTSSSTCMDQQRFATQAVASSSFGSESILSTIRPNQNFQRTPLSTMDMWTGQGAAGPNYGIPVAYNAFTGSRRSSEGEVKNARDHPYYQAEPRNKLYYCPFATTEDCTHKPEKLKCNYE